MGSQAAIAADSFPRSSEPALEERKPDGASIAVGFHYSVGCHYLVATILLRDGYGPIEIYLVGQGVGIIRCVNDALLDPPSVISRRRDGITQFFRIYILPT